MKRFQPSNLVRKRRFRARMATVAAQGPSPRAPQPRPQEAVGLNTNAIGKLRRRADFLAANGALRAPTPAFVLLVRPRGDDDGTIRLGLTVSKRSAMPSSATG